MFGSTLVLQQYDDAGIEYNSLHIHSAKQCSYCSCFDCSWLLHF